MLQLIESHCRFQLMWRNFDNARLAQRESACCRHMWDMRTADASGQTVLHLASQLNDEGNMAGLLLAHPACPNAGALWSTLKDAAGQTPADIVCRCIFSLEFRMARHMLISLSGSFPYLPVSA